MKQTLLIQPMNVERSVKKILVTRQKEPAENEESCTTSPGKMSVSWVCTCANDCAYMRTPYSSGFRGGNESGTCVRASTMRLSYEPLSTSVRFQCSRSRNAASPTCTPHSPKGHASRRTSSGTEQPQVYEATVLRVVETHRRLAGAV